MKKIVFFLSLLFTFIVVEAQTQAQEMVSVPKSQLTAQQLAEIELQNQVQRIETYGKWVGIGNEIGAAVRESLLGVVDVADKFGNTDVGKFTIVMVAWKVMGKDVIRIILGLLFYVMITWLFVKVYKNTYVPKRIMVENPGFMKYPKKYEIVKPDSSWDGYQAVKILMLFLYAGAIGITYAIMFG